MHYKQIDGGPLSGPPLVVEFTPEEAADRDALDEAFPAKLAARQAEASRIGEFRTACVGDATLQAMLGMTFAQFDTWWGNNVTTAAQAITVLKRLTWGFLLLIRKIL